jgi:hypothetical protein
MNATDKVLLSGNITLSVDVTAGRGKMRVHCFEPALSIPPAERQGLALDECAVLQPEMHQGPLVRRDCEIQAWCGDQEIAMPKPFPGYAEHLFTVLPAPGTYCEVAIDDEHFALPPLPVAPIVHVQHGRLRWVPAQGDELRFVVPRNQGENTLCRLRDDGDAPAPPGARRNLAFASRVRLAMPSTQDDAKIPVAVIAGTWRTPSD